MPKGQVEQVPDDGLTTRQRRRTPVLAVHTGVGKGKSTAAFGMALRAWNAGWPIAVFQFVKSPKWRVGEEAAFRALGEAHAASGADAPVGAPVTWHKMGEGWSWLRSRAASKSLRDRPPGSERDHAAEAAEGWAQIKRDLAAERYTFYLLDEFTYPMHWGWVDVADVVHTLRERPGTQHVVITGRYAAPELIETADLVTEMAKVKHPMDAGRKGQAGIEW